MRRAHGFRNGLAFAVRILSGLVIAALFVGDGHASRDREEFADGPTITRTREADDIARFLAGLPGTPESPFAKLEASKVWQEHRERLDDAWGKAEKDLIVKLSAFQKQELNNDPAWSAPVFYPFGGPDALTVTLLFPKSPAYIIVGLEPAGTLPTFQQIEKMDLAKYLAETRETMASELGRSFFITRDMDRQFRGQVTDGLLLPILQLLARTHHQILGFRYMRLDDGGEIIDRSPSYKAPTRFGNKGVEIEFKSETDSSVQKLYYFTVNLSNERLIENKPFLTYLSRLSDVNTFLKATSYLTHKAAFSMIREGILDHSANVLQDDSGIPYSFFRSENWTVQLYGEYTHPYGSFRWMEQPSLRDAYSEAGAKPLSLRLGYGYAKVGSNLLLARRRK